MKVLVVTSEFPYLSETFIVDHIVGLIDRGCDVHILSMSRPTQEFYQTAIREHGLLSLVTYGTVENHGRIKAILTSALSCVRMRNLSWQERMRLLWSSIPFRTHQRRNINIVKLLKEWKPHIVHCHYGFNGRALTAIRDNLGMSFPVVTSFHGCDMSDTNRGHYADLFRSGEQFIANTSFTRDALIERGCSPERISIQPVGVNVEGLPKRSTEPVLTGSLRLISVARLVEFKGLSVAISAVAHLRDQGVDCHYRIVGEGHLHQDLQAQITLLDLDDRVSLLGAMPREEVFAEIGSADVFLLPSIFFNGRTETQGLVAQEAQAIGTPVVASRIGGIPDAVVHGETGMLSQPGDHKDLANQIIAIARSPELMKDIVTRSRALIMSQYSNAALARRMIETYMRLVKQPTVDMDLEPS